MEISSHVTLKPLVPGFGIQGLAPKVKGQGIGGAG